MHSLHDNMKFLLETNNQGETFRKATLNMMRKCVVSCHSPWKKTSSDRSCVSHLKPEISQVNGCNCLEVGPTAYQTWGLLISLECSCNWLPLFEKNKAENRPLGNLSSFSFKVHGDPRNSDQMNKENLSRNRTKKIALPCSLNLALSMMSGQIVVLKAL